MSDHLPGSLTGNRRGSLMSPKVCSVKVLCEGYMEKKSPKSLLSVHAWQRRYFVLTISTTDRGTHYKVLSYFKTAEDEEPLGNIPLIDVKSVNVSKEKTGRFDVVIKGRTYMLRVDNATDLQNWVNALSSTGSKPAYTKPANLPNSPAETMKLMADASPEAAKLFDSTETIKMMKEGSAFIKYDLDSTNDVDRSIVLVFYKDDDGSELGSLYWCEPGERQDVSVRALALHQLSDLYLGKQSKAFKHPIAASAPADRCFTASSTAGTDFHLEGDTKELVAAWLFGVNSIMMTRGNRKVTSVKKKDAAANAAAAAKANEASVSSSAASTSTSSTSESAKREEEAEVKDIQINSVTLDENDGKPAAVLSEADNARFQEVKDWLTGLGSLFEPYYVAFRDNGIDMSFLLNLNDDDLEDLGVSVRLHRKKMLMTIDELRIAKGMHGRDEIIVEPSAAPMAPPMGGAPTTHRRAGSNVPAAPASGSVPSAPGMAPFQLPAFTPGTASPFALRPAATKAANAEPEIVQMDAIMEGIRQAKLRKAARPVTITEKKDDEPEFVQLLRKAQEAKRLKSERASINLNGGTIAELAKKMAEDRRKAKDVAKDELAAAVAAAKISEE